jgi:hypothetical protein
MKWKSNIALSPQVGDTRIRTKFAWIPISVYSDNQCYKVWLETYLITEEYEKIYVNSDGFYYCKAQWKITKREPIF